MKAITESIVWLGVGAMVMTKAGQRKSQTRLVRVSHIMPNVWLMFNKYMWKGEVTNLPGSHKSL